MAVEVGVMVAVVVAVELGEWVEVGTADANPGMTAAMGALVSRQAVDSAVISAVNRMIAR